MERNASEAIEAIEVREKEEFLPKMGRINESMKQLETAMEELERQLGVERKREEQESHKEGV